MSLGDLLVTVDAEDINVKVIDPPTIDVTHPSTPDLKVVILNNAGLPGPVGPPGPQGDPGPPGEDGTGGGFGDEVNFSDLQDLDILTFDEVIDKWVNKHVTRRVFNVKDFDAVGDGNQANADLDTLGIKTALGLAAVHGGDVYFPFGTYIWDDGVNSLSIPSNVRLIGDGWALSTIKLVNNKTNLTHMVTANNHDQVAIENITIDGNVIGNESGTNTNTLYLAHVTNFRFIKARVLCGRGRCVGGIDLDGAVFSDGVIDGSNGLSALNDMDPTWLNNNMDYSVNPPVKKNDSIVHPTWNYTPDSMGGIWIYNVSNTDVNRMTITGTAALSLSFQTFTTDQTVFSNYCKSISITDCRISNAPSKRLNGGYGIYLFGATDFTIEGNKVTGVVGDNINATWCKQFTIENNRVFNSGVGELGGYGICLFNGCQAFIVSGNFVNQNQNPSSGIGIEGYYHGGVVTNNVCILAKADTTSGHNFGIGAGIVITGQRYNRVGSSIPPNYDLHMYHYTEEGGTSKNTVLVVTGNTLYANSYGLAVRETTYSRPTKWANGSTINYSDWPSDYTLPPANGTRITIESIIIANNNIAGSTIKPYDFVGDYTSGLYWSGVVTVSSDGIPTWKETVIPNIRVDLEDRSINMGGSGGGGSGGGSGGPNIDTLLNLKGSLAVGLGSGDGAVALPVLTDDFVLTGDHTTSSGLRYVSRVDPAANAQGYDAWAFNPALIQGADELTPGTVFCAGLWIPNWTDIDKVTVIISQTAVIGSGGGAGPATLLQFAILSQDGKVRALSANVASALSTAGTTGPWDIPISLIAGSPYQTNRIDSPRGWHYLAMIQVGLYSGVGAKQPSFGRAQNSINAAKPHGAYARPWATGLITNRNGMPPRSTIPGPPTVGDPGIIAGGLTNANSKAFWAGVSQ